MIVFYLWGHMYVRGLQILDAVKLAECGDGSVILRVFEGLGGRGVCTLTSCFTLAIVTCVNLLEQQLPDADVAPIALCMSGPHTFTFALKPFQIVSFKVEVKK